MRLILGISFVFLCICLKVSAAEEIPTLEIGQPAPSFALPGTDGQIHRLGDYAQAKVLVVIFTCNHCPTAQAYEERIKQLTSEYRNRGVQVVAISPNDPLSVRLDELGYTDLSDSLEEMKQRAEYRKFNFPYLYDGETQQVSKAYGPKATPHVFVFDDTRKLRYTGRIDDNERRPDQAKSRDTRNAIEAILAGLSVPVEQTRTFGCSIKWADKREAVQKSLAKWAQEPVLLENLALSDLQALLRNDSGKLRMINVWATWCGPCNIEFPDLVTMHRMYRGREFELITISADAPEDREKAIAFLRKQQCSARNITFNGSPYELFEVLDQAVGGKMSSGALPYTLLIKPRGEVIYRHEGQIESLEVKRKIVGILGNTYR
jgi:peroxiredoxin